MTVLIADDEEHARDYLVQLVDKHPDLDLLDTCKSGNEVIKYCSTIHPDLILLDIQMPGKNGIDTAEVLSKKNISSTIVFTTAFDQYAIRAFEVEALGYLVKPFSEVQFKKVIERVMAISASFDSKFSRKKLESLKRNYQQPSNSGLQKLLIKQRGLEIEVPVVDIAYLQADSEYVKLITAGDNYLYRISLEILSRQLPGNFIRVHRSYIINLDKVVSWKYLNNNTFQFVLPNDTILASSRSYKHSIQNHLSK